MSDETFAPFERDKPDHMQTVRNIAEAHAEEIAEGRFQPAVLFMDDSDEARTIFFPSIDGEDESKMKMAWAMRVLSAAIDDLWSIAFVVDTYHATGKKHDGSEWGPNEMGYAFENKTVDADLVTEALTYQMITGDTFYMTTVPYTRTGDTIEYQWDDVLTMNDEGDNRFGGFYPDAMREAYNAKKIMLIPEAGQLMEALGIDMDVARLHSLIAAVKLVLTQTQMPALIPCRNQEEVEILRESFGQEPGVAVLDQDQVEEIASLEKQFRMHTEDE